MRIEVITELYKALAHIQKAINELKADINNSNEAGINNKPTPEVRI